MSVFDTCGVESISGINPPEIPDEGHLWAKLYKDLGVHLIHFYDGKDWHLSYDKDDIGEMIDILSLFGEVKIKQLSKGSFWCSFFPDNQGALWYHQSKPSMKEALQGLIEDSIRLKIL